MSATEYPIDDMTKSILSSLLVMFGASGLALLLGFVIALGLSRAKIVGKPFLFFLLGGFLFVPLYVQAAGWSAGFGTQGWWTLSQVTGSKEPLRGLQAVIWIHAMGCIPAIVLILLCGFNRTIKTREEVAFVEGGIWRTLTRVWIRSNIGWIAAAFAWSLSTVGNDMLVTNLYQVRTAVEKFYLDITVGQYSFVRAAVACIPALILALLCGWFAASPDHFRLLGRLDLSNRTWFMKLGATICWSVGCWLLIGLSTLLPLANLVIKSGWDATHVGERIERRWLLTRLMESTFGSPLEYGDELRWSLQLSLYASVSCILLAALIVPRIPKSAWLRGIVFGIFGFMLALPGPAVNLIVSWLFLSLPIPILEQCYDRTLIPTVLAINFRALPIAIFLLTISWNRWYNVHQDLLAMEGRKGSIWMIWRYSLASWGTLAIIWLWLFAVSFADFSSYSQLLPPSVTTVSKRIFELLHYGVRYQEAGLCLFLALCGMAIGGIAMMLFSRSKT